MKVATIRVHTRVCTEHIRVDPYPRARPKPTPRGTQSTIVNAIKSARKFIVANPASESARTLAQLVLALESDTHFNVAELYKLELETFEIAIDILKEWRIDRYYAGKAKLFDLSVQVSGLPA